ADGISPTVVNCRFLKPMDETLLAKLGADNELMVTVEDGTRVNGFGAQVAHFVSEARGQASVVVMGAPDRTYEHAARARQLAAVGLSAEGIAETVTAWRAEESLSPR
ncbi:MAG: transketolase C-terminal domain-containing protein, partial [Gemmatimonadales bacterium]